MPPFPVCVLQVRVIMRQEKTLKVCANHLVDSSTTLAPMAGSDRAWVSATQSFIQYLI